MQNKPAYRIYPSLLDAFTAFRRSGEIYDFYWGFSDNPPCTPEEFEQKQLQELLDKINRVPAEPSEAALRGTALNALIDRLACATTDPRAECIPVIEEQEACQDNDLQPITASHAVAYDVHINDRGSEATFRFPASLADNLAQRYAAQHALPQVFLSAALATPRYGLVELYGYADYVLPLSIHDLKTTSRYQVGKYRHGAQHLIYPYCNDAHRTQRFDYDVAECSRGGVWQLYTESYQYLPERDIPRLTRKVEAFCEFLEQHRDDITDRKIFGETETDTSLTGS